MSKASKFAGGGRAGNTAPSGVPRQSKVAYTPKSRGPSSPSVSNSRPARLGSLAVTEQGCSSHNDISTFLRSAKSRGPYGGPSFRSFDRYEENYKQATPSSSIVSPSGGKASTGRPIARTRGADSYNDPMRVSRRGERANVAPSDDKRSLGRGAGTGRL